MKPIGLFDLFKTVPEPMTSSSRTCRGASPSLPLRRHAPARPPWRTATGRHRWRAGDCVRHPPGLPRTGEHQVDGQVEYFLREFDRAFHLCAAARKNDARRDHLLVSGAAKFILNQRIELLVAGFDHLGQGLPRQSSGRPVADARNLDRLVRIGELRQRAGVLDLDFLGMQRRCAQ